MDVGRYASRQASCYRQPEQRKQTVQQESPAMFKPSGLRPALIGCLFMGLVPSSMAAPKAPAADTMDRDLVEVTVPQLERYYAEDRYTATQVVRWHLARIHMYDGIYRAVEQVLEKQPLETAPREDAEASRGGARGPLWGV